MISCSLNLRASALSSSCSSVKSKPIIGHSVVCAIATPGHLSRRSLPTDAATVNDDWDAVRKGGHLKKHGGPTMRASSRAGSQPRAGDCRAKPRDAQFGPGESNVSYDY